MSKTHKGKCLCGAVEIEATGTPMGMGYCHCESCRAWASALVHTWTAWKPEDVVVTKGAEHIASFSKTENSIRKFCSKCGGNILTNHPSMRMVDVCAGTLPSLTFEPSAHFNYGESVHRMKDGLPKIKDFPEEMGGSGEMLPE